MHFSFVLAGLALVSLGSALTSTLQKVTGFTSSPTKATMYVYLPTTRAAKPAVIVAIHYCQGSASAYFSGASYPASADTYGYIIIYPQSPSAGGCWDVASQASLTHNGGGDSQTIVNMVTYAINNYGADASKVYVTGSSSGAMMTNVLVAAYPEVFQAASVYSGVAAGCFAVAGTTANMATPGWNSQCSNGQVSKTGAAWGSLVHSYYSGYTGPYPRIML
jgi:acetylxylan esterase